MALRSLRFVTSLALLAAISGAPDAARAEESPLPQRAYAVLKKHCARCHGEEQVIPGLDMLDRAALIENGYLAPGDAERSLLWQRVGVEQDMPPQGEPQPSTAERETLEEWILAGAEFPSLGDRPFVSISESFQAVRDHLRSADTQDRPFQRYFTLTHLNNNAENVTSDEYRLYQAALSKALNSLSWAPRIALPQALDPQGTVFAIDLRDYGWTRESWKKILQRYPYGLRHDRSSDRDLRQIAREVYDLSGVEIPALRADWFVATATRPPLYHTLLEIPQTAAELEDELRVDVERDFLQNRLSRAAFASSGVSGQNRLVDRHDASLGTYWKSYDFKENRGRGDLFRFPLGPDFANNSFSEQAFEHDGGEMIFSLPNGLHGYMLTDGEGARIDAGPIEVVSDSLKTSGTPVIVNGLSCMGCHKRGMIDFDDALRDGAAVFGAAREKVEALTPPAEQMQRLLDRDRRQYLQSLEQAIGPFLQVDAAAGKPIESFPEPVSAIARRHQRDLNLEDVAAELGFEDAGQLELLIANSGQLKSLGLGALASGSNTARPARKIKREAWDNLDRGLSMFQRAALTLQRGTPHRVFP